MPKLIEQMRATLVDEGAKQEFRKLYGELCNQVQDLMPDCESQLQDLVDESIRQTHQDAHKKIHRLVEEKIKPKNGEIIKLKRENGVCRMCIKKQQEQIKELQEQLETMSQALMSKC